MQRYYIPAESVKHYRAICELPAQEFPLGTFVGPEGILFVGHCRSMKNNLVSTATDKDIERINIIKV